jgi:hypothetical protein
MVPGDLCKHPLHKCLLRPCLSKGTHTLQIARRETFLIGKSPA